MERDLSTDDGPPPPINWWPMIFSVFVVFLPLALVAEGNANPLAWKLTLIASALLVILTAIAVASWQRNIPLLWIPVALGVIGVILAPYNYMAVLFFLFAAAICPWGVDGHIQRSATLALLVVMGEMFLGAVEPVPEHRMLWLLDAPLFTIGNVAAGVWLCRMTLSIQRLGRIAVRERITRDLHDVLGDALSLIACKSLLAGRLLERNSDISGVREDIADIETASRAALTDVRNAIRRYRSEGVEVTPSLPDSATQRINWWPMLFAIYIVFLPVGFWRLGGGSAVQWLLVWAGVAVFLGLVATAILAWQRQRPFLHVVLSLTLLGFAFSHYVPSADVFIIFAAALAPVAVNGNIARTVQFVAALVVVSLGIGEWNAFLHPEGVEAIRQLWGVTVPICIGISAAGYLWAVRMSLRHLALAKVAERERIARDLHDVLGHTLSLITLKSELAGRLLSEQNNIERARLEMADVQRISGHALNDVRTTILGDRAETIDAEFERAAATLRTAGIEVQCLREPVRLGAMHEGILGLALREAVTNIVRHAGARHCHISLQQTSQTCVLEVQDDGRGGEGVEGGEGQGLRGMRERIEALGGTVRRDMSTGTRLTVRVPAMITQS